MLRNKGLFSFNENGPFVMVLNKYLVFEPNNVNKLMNASYNVNITKGGFQMAFGAGGAGGLGAGIAIVVVIILLLIAMGIVF